MFSPLVIVFTNTFLIEYNEPHLDIKKKWKKNGNNMIWHLRRWAGSTLRAHSSGAIQRLTCAPVSLRLLHEALHLHQKKMPVLQLLNAELHVVQWLGPVGCPRGPLVGLGCVGFGVLGYRPRTNVCVDPGAVQLVVAVHPALETRSRRFLTPRGDRKQ